MPDRKFKDGAELRNACEEYFNKCDADGRLYSEPGLLLHLGISVSSWDNWYEGDNCPDLKEETRRACLRIQDQIWTHPLYQEKGGMNSRAIFLLKQKRLGGYQDRIEAKQDMTVNIKMNTYDQTEQSQEWQRLREATGETGFYPSAKIPKTISGNGISKELNYEERQDFQRQRGGYLMITVSDMLGNPLYKRAGDSGQVQLMTDVRDYANNAAKADVLGPDSVGSWITKTAEAQQKTGLRTADVIAYRRLYLDAKERDSRTANEKVRQAIMNDTRLSAAQKNALDGIILTDGRYIPDEKNVDYSNKKSFQITQMSDSAAKHWDLVKDMDGMTPERYGQAWEIYNRKGTKENKYTKDMKLRDLQNELGFSRQEAARLYKLMGEEVE